MDIDSKNYEVKKKHFIIKKIEDKSANSSSNMNNIDLKLVENNEVKESKKTFNCNICGKIFGEKGNFSIHMRVHTQEKPFVCPYINCDETFKAHGHLKDHMKKHFNVKPYKCSLCKEQFSRQSTLKMHYYTHVQTKPYKCYFNDCDKYFVDKTQLKFHFKSHYINESQEQFEKIFGDYFQKYLPNINKLIKLRDQEIEKTIKKNPLNIEIPKFIKRGNTYDIIYYENGKKIVDTTTDKDKIKDTYLNLKKVNMSPDAIKQVKIEGLSKIRTYPRRIASKKYFKGKNPINDNIHKRINDLKEEEVKFEEILNEAPNIWVEKSKAREIDEEYLISQNLLKNLAELNRNIFSNNLFSNEIEINEYNYKSFLFLVHLFEEKNLNSLLFEISQYKGSNNSNYNFLRILLEFINNYKYKNVVIKIKNVPLTYKESIIIFSNIFPSIDLRTFTYNSFIQYFSTKFGINSSTFYEPNSNFNSSKSIDLYNNFDTGSDRFTPYIAHNNVYNDNEIQKSGFQRLVELANAKTKTQNNNNHSGLYNNFNSFKPHNNAFNSYNILNHNKDINLRTSSETMRKEKIIINDGKLLNSNGEYDNIENYNFNSGKSEVIKNYDFGSKNIDNIFKD